MTIATDPMFPAQLVMEMDPRVLLIDLNIRDLKPDPDLVASIRDLGVLQPVVGYRTLGNAVRVRFGHRRTLAAIEAGRATVPVLVVADEAFGGQADVERILGQYAENKFRAGLTVADEAGAVAQLFDLGLTAGQVQKRTRLPKASVAAAKALRASAVATETAAAHPELTLDQAAALAEFDDDPAAVSRLVQAARNDGQFRHTVQDLRDHQAADQAYAAAAADLAAAGITVVEDRPAWEHSVRLLRDAGGQEITDEAHKDCPGHIAVLEEGWDDDSNVIWRPRFYCADPAANGHQQRDGAAAGGVDLEAQRADRSKVIKGNNAWRNAETVRRAWLAEFLARKEAPKNGLRYVIEAITLAYSDFHRSDFHRSHQAGYEIAQALLGIEGSLADAVSVARVSDARALVMTLGLVLSATESEAASVMVWRTPTQASHIASYFKTLVGWGYTLSEIEQAVADGKSWEPAE